jgi:hypothetical protein
MQQPTKFTKSNPLVSNIKNWFDSLVAHIRVDQLMIETDTAPTQKKEFYSAVMTGDALQIVKTTRQISSQFYLETLLKDYLKNLIENKNLPQKIAFDLSGNKILVWAIINDEDELAENNLILSEAKVNSKYSEHGFSISSTVVEISDNLKIPPHYKEIHIVR